MNLTIKRMATPPNPNQTDWTFLGVIYGIFGSIIAVMFKWIDSFFSSRKTEREAFIRAVVSEAMSTALKDVNDKVSALFEYREKDRENLDRKFETVMKELKK